MALQPASANATKARIIGIRIRVVQFNGVEAGAPESVGRSAIGFNSSKRAILHSTALTPGLLVDYSGGFSTPICLKMP